jgi:ATP-dependent Clp protease ATP-binding subunit ClpB
MICYGGTQIFMHADKLTIRSQEALATASRLAQERHSPQITPTHLLAALLDAEGVVLPVLAKLGASLPALRAETTRAFDDLPRLGEDSSTEGGQPSTELLTVLQAAEQEVAQLSDQYVSTEHLLLALAAEEGRAGQALRAVGASRERLLQALAEVRARIA